MYYFVTIATSVGRQLNHIKAQTSDEARTTVAAYNKRHPDWKLKLLKRNPVHSQTKLETRLFRR